MILNDFKLHLSQKTIIKITSCMTTTFYYSTGDASNCSSLSQAVHLQYLYIQEMLPHATWRKFRSSRWELTRSHSFSVASTSVLMMLVYVNAGKWQLCLFFQDFPWIVADEQEVHMHEPRLIPLKTMTSDIVKVSRNNPLIHVFICRKAQTNTHPKSNLSWPRSPRRTNNNKM